MEISTKFIDVFKVKKKELVTPHYMRITFHIPARLITKFKNILDGSNNKLFIPPEGTNVIYFPNIQNRYVLEESIAKVRTYTNRKIDLINQELKIDFVLHKKYGPGSFWASNSKIGDAIGIGLKQGIKTLIPKFKHYTLIGDHTALPLISVILENLSEDTQAEVLLEVYDSSDELLLSSSAKTNIRWIHNQNPEKGSQLGNKSKAILKNKKKHDTYVYIAAEYSTVHELKNYLKEYLLWNNSNYNAVVFWSRSK